jgi:hypothetical protein
MTGVVTTPKKESETENKTLPNMSMASEVIMDWKGWLKEGTFYLHGMIYMIVRIAVNVTMVKNFSKILNTFYSLFNHSICCM